MRKYALLAIIIAAALAVSQCTNKSDNSHRAVATNPPASSFLHTPFFPLDHVNGSGRHRPQLICKREHGKIHCREADRNKLLNQKQDLGTPPGAVHLSTP